MDLHDILYIDLQRFESLASQRMQGITQITRLNDAAVIEKTDTTGSVQKGVLTDKTDESSTRSRATVREIRNLDDQFHRFVTAISPGVISLSDGGNLHSLCDRALMSGELVTASGPFFYDDFDWMRASIQELSKVQEVLGKLGVKNEGLDAVKKYATPMASMIGVFYGKSIECGVRVEGASGPMLVRAFLESVYLRDNSRNFVSRYGSKTRVNFTILGVVSRVGWNDDSTELNFDDDDDGGISDAMKKAMHEMQNQVMNIQRVVFGSGKKSVQVVPVAVYRTITVSGEVPEVK
jgi:hypothetical protein